MGYSLGFITHLLTIDPNLLGHPSKVSILASEFSPEPTRSGKVLIVPNNLSHTVPGIIEAVDFTIGFQKLPNIGLNQSSLEVKPTIKIYKNNSLHVCMIRIPLLLRKKSNWWKPIFY